LVQLCRFLNSPTVEFVRLVQVQVDPVYGKMRTRWLHR